MNGKSSAEYRTLIACTSDLRLAVGPNLFAISGALLGKGLISQEKEAAIRNKAISNSAEGPAAELIELVQNKVQQNPQHYSTFISILQQDQDQHEDILTLLDKKYKSYNGERSLDSVHIYSAPALGRESEMNCRIEDLEGQFRRLYEDILKELKKNDTSAEDLILHLSLLPTRIRPEYETAIKRHFHIPPKDAEIGDVFIRLAELFDFLSYGLLKCIIDRFGSSSLKSSMDSYSKEVDAFMHNTKVKQVMDIWPGRQELSDSFKKLEVIINKDPASYTLGQLDNLRRQFCCELKLTSVVFALNGLKESNSFIAEWLFPSTLLSCLNESARELDPEFCSQEAILKMTVDGKHFLASAAVSGVLNEFKISLESMKDMKKLLMADFNKGLEEEGNHVKVKMFPTFIHSMPNGTEEGEFLVLEMTGAKYCIQKYWIGHGSPRITDGYREEYVIQGEKARPHMEGEDKGALSSYGRIELGVLFDEIAEKMSKFIEKEGIHPMGFSLSFPIQHLSINSGRLARWTKEVVIDGAVGKELIHILKQAFVKYGVGVNIVAFINNTTAIMLSVASEAPDCHVGVLLGQGSNASYIEKVSAVPKFKGDEKHSHVIINCELGAFGELEDHGKLYKWTIYDSQVDKGTINCGEQLFEKMICGKFLGDIVRLVLKKLIQDKVLLSKFEGWTPPNFDKSVLKAQDVSSIENGTADDCKRLLEKKFSVEASMEDCEIVRRVCTAVSTRSARLAATVIVALVEKINKLDSDCTVAVEGSLYRMYYNYPERLKDAMEELAPRNKIKMVPSNYGASGGAAIAAAIACRSSSDDK